MSQFKVGDRVEWTSQSGGNTRTKVGVVETVIPAHQQVVAISKNRNPGEARPHTSYLVRVKGKGLYWPRVSALALAPPAAPADQSKETTHE